MPVYPGAFGQPPRFPINVSCKINELWSENGVSPPFFHGFFRSRLRRKATPRLRTCTEIGLSAPFRSRLGRNGTPRLTPWDPKRAGAVQCVSRFPSTTLESNQPLAHKQRRAHRRAFPGFQVETHPSLILATHNGRKLLGPPRSRDDRKGRDSLFDGWRFASAASSVTSGFVRSSSASSPTNGDTFFPQAGLAHRFEEVPA